MNYLTTINNKRYNIPPSPLDLNCYCLVKPLVRNYINTFRGNIIFKNNTYQYLPSNPMLQLSKEDVEYLRPSPDAENIYHSCLLTINTPIKFYPS